MAKKKITESKDETTTVSKNVANNDRLDELSDYIFKSMPLITLALNDIRDELKQSAKNDEKQKDTYSNQKNFFKETKKNLSEVEKKLSSIDSTLKEANKQRELAADLAEERDQEAKDEAEFKREKEQEKIENQNAEIISKLTKLDDSIQGIELPGKDNSKGMLSSLLSSLTGNGLAKLASGILTNPIFLTALTGAAVLGLAKIIYESYVSPYMDKALGEAKQIMNADKGLEKTAVTTSTGESVFTKTDESSGKVSAITEQEYSKLTPEQQTEYTKLETTKDQSGREFKSPVDMVLPIPSGGTIEEIQDVMSKRQELQAKMIYEPKSNEVSAAKYSYYDNELQNFQEDFRKQVAEVVSNVREMEDKTSEMDPAVYASTIQNVDAVMSGLLSRHKDLIEKIKTDQSLQPIEKEKLMNSNPLTYGGMDYSPSYINLSEGGGFIVGAGRYLLPSQFESNQILRNKRRKEMGIPVEAEIGVIPKVDDRVIDLPEIISRSSTFFGLGGADRPDINQKLNAISPKQEVPQMREGGFVKESSDSVGRNINVAEVGTGGEFVIPYDKMGNFVKEASDLHANEVGNDITQVMRTSYFEEKDASVFDKPVIINNISNKKESSHDQGTTFQYQTNLAKTYDSVFDYIIEKNMRTAIT